MHKTSTLLLGLGVWMPAVSIVYFAGLLWALPFAVIAGISVLLIPLVLMVVNRITRRDSSPELSRASALLLLGGIALLAGAGALLGRRYGDFDAALIWNLHARHLSGGDDWRRMYLPGASGNAAYPFGLPGVVALGWRVVAWLGLDHFPPVVPYTISLFSTMAIPVVIFLRTAWRHLGIGIGVLAAFGLYPYYIALGLDQYADIQVGWLMLLAALCLERMRVFPGRGYALLTGALLGAMCWTKYEGFLIAGALLAWHPRFFLIRKNAAALALGVAPFAIAWILLQKVGAPPSPLIIDPAVMAHHARDTSRYAVTANAFLHELGGTHLPLAALLLVYPALSLRFKLRMHSLYGAVWTIMMGFAAVYVLLVTTDMDWNLRFSLPRLLLQIYPTLVLITAIRIQVVLDSRQGAMR